MGTNYYLHVNTCSHCGRPEDTQHIGKKSLGWVFTFNSHYIKSWDDWQVYLLEQTTNGNLIKDENGRELSLDEFKEVVESSKGGIKHDPPDTDGVFSYLPCDFI
jgi:hypothetical protein